MKEKLFKGLKLVFALGLCVGLLWVSIALAAPGDIERISNFDDDSFNASISGDGVYVAFETWEQVTTQYYYQVYVADRAEHPIAMTKIEVGLGHYEYPAISADGEWLAYRFDDGDDQVIHLLEWQVKPWVPIVIDPPVEVENDYRFRHISISADGCRVAYFFEFEDDDEDDIEDVYYYDCIEHESFLVSKAYGSDARGNDNSRYTSISENGQFVAFSSYATNLVTNPPPAGERHVYVRDLEVETTKRILLPGDWANKDGITTYGTSLSADGCYVAFEYGYEGWYYDIFLYDCHTDETKLISIFDDKPSGDSESPSISGDGRFVTFHKWVDDVVQIHVYDSATDEIKLVSKNLNGDPGNGHSADSDISADGCFIAFESEADDLIINDDNDNINVYVAQNHVICYALTVAIEPENSGTVTLNTAYGVYPQGTIVTLTPEPAEGFVFDGWSGLDAVELQDNGDGTWSITMDGDKSVTANFVEELIDTTTYIFLPLIMR